MDIRNWLNDFMNHNRPLLSQITDNDDENYKNLIEFIQSLSKLKEKKTTQEIFLKTISQLGPLKNPENIYLKYWADIKEKAIKRFIKNISKEEKPLIEGENVVDRTKAATRAIMDIGGEIKTTTDGLLYKSNIIQLSSIAPKSG